VVLDADLAPDVDGVVVAFHLASTAVGVSGAALALEWIEPASFVVTTHTLLGFILCDARR